MDMTVGKELRNQRNINFCPTCTIVLIPSRNEYKAAGLYSCLWWSTDDYFGFQQSAISEVRMLVHGKNIAVKAAKRILYQPNEDMRDEIDEETPLINDNNGNNENNNDEDCVPNVPNVTKGVAAAKSITVSASISSSNSSNDDNNDDSFYLGEEIDDDNNSNEILTDTISIHSEQSEETVELNKKISRVSSLECIDTSKIKRTLAQSTSYMNLNSATEESMTSYDCLCLCVPLPQGSKIIFDRKKRHMASVFAPFHGPIIVLLLIVVALLLVDKII